MAQIYEKIPIVVGITGHRNIVEEDKPAIKEQVKAALAEIKQMCRAKDKRGEDTPVIMLNGLAQGADMLCAEAAFEEGIDVYAVLPREAAEYENSFDDEKDRAKLAQYLSLAKKQIIAPDLETNGKWLEENADVNPDSYEYRQLGIYIAEHSHILIALWDGKPPKVSYGCGTIEVIKFALEHDYFDKNHLFTPGSINDSAVIWIKSRRQGDGGQADIKRVWMSSNLVGKTNGENVGEYSYGSEPPAYLKSIIDRTVRYNERSVSMTKKVSLWKETEELDDYRTALRYHHAKADVLSYAMNQSKYNKFLLLLAITASLVAAMFLVYDDASVPIFIFPCTAFICAVIALFIIGKKKNYHKNFIDYRALAEALRIQFYLSLCLDECPVTSSVCELYSWAQKVDFAWIDKALRAIAATHDARKLAADRTKVLNVWIGTNSSPTGQLRYHTGKIAKNAKSAKKYDNIAAALLSLTLAVYFAIFVLEIVACALGGTDVYYFWEKDICGVLPYRSLGAILLGTLTAASLLFSSYFGKLSYGRKTDDNDKMSRLYAAALSRWDEVSVHSENAIENYVKAIARDEIVENGIWYSYVNENTLEINV